MTEAASVGTELRRWRRLRRRSQLDLALDAGISTRHLSFVETGRSRPSRDLVLNLSDQLRVPLRGRNALLLQAGYAPVHPERPLDDPSLGAAREAIRAVIAAYAPYPALAIDRHWTMIEANAPLLALMDGVSAALLAPPINPLRISLHPDGLAPRIANLPVWRGALFRRMEIEAANLGDDAIVDLLAELRAYPGGEAAPPAGAAIAVPLEIDTAAGRLSLLSMTTVFGTPLDVTLSELAIEAFLPADAATAERLARIAGA